MNRTDLFQNTPYFEVIGLLAEFEGEMIECEEEVILPWGPRVLIQLEDADDEKQQQNRAQLLAVCAEIQQKKGQGAE